MSDIEQGLSREAFYDILNRMAVGPIVASDESALRRYLVARHDDIARLREKLAWYASITNYNPDGIAGSLVHIAGEEPTWVSDEGDRAEEALSE